jgi:hypothetical protein
LESCIINKKKPFPTQANHQLNYLTSETGYLTLNGNIEGQNIQVRLTQLEVNKLPLLLPDFSWTINEIP